MDKVYTDEKVYEIGEIGNLIKDKKAKERALIKAEELSKIKLSDFSRDDYDIKIVSQPKLSGNLLEISVIATKDKKKIEIDNPLQFLNPPIMVPDGTYHKEIIFDRETDIHNFREDPEEALHQIIVQTIKLFDK